MIALLKQVVDRAVRALDQQPRLGEIRDDLSDTRLKADGSTGLRVKVLPGMSGAESPLLMGGGVYAPLEFPFLAERVEQVPSGQIIISRQLLDGQGRDQLVRSLRGLARASDTPIKVPELGSLPQE